MSKVLVWLASQDYSRVCILSDSLSVVRKAEAGYVRRRTLGSLQKSKIRRVSSILSLGSGASMEMKELIGWLALPSSQIDSHWIEPISNAEREREKERQSGGLGEQKSCLN